MCGKRKTQTANDNDLISVSLKSFAPLPMEGADERSEAGLVSSNVGVPFHAANLRPFGAPPSKGRREKKGAACIVIGLVAAKWAPSLLYPLPLNPPYHFFSRGKRRGVRHMWGKRESLTAKVQGSRGGFAAIDGSGRSCSGIRYLTYDVSRRSG